MRSIFLTFPFLLAACATVHETYAPDGRKAYALNCSGAARGWDKCLAAAGDRCGAAGYDVFDRNGEPMAAFGGGANGFGGGLTAERSMIVACKVH
ncbi:MULTISPECIES: hypothetical protein [pseudomallei group]|uniref:hypothetical protein n=1 Tax=pseudomallei group TaxID=111527 RepID=UPI0003C0715E|nr:MULTISPECIES: hypothetical protein [pseudomallei group]AGZ32721.1 putative oRF62 [Burkholderia pseudomallei NCTC 13179]AJX90496.1 putative oRF62 [Burkholderia pseudomallei]AUL54980.1 hypothetical protein BHT10_02950 [Burkholderia pseudomallei]KGU90202.1 putative oRF62 [Burkholderia pseudomallei MSHR4032]MBF3461837.1 hypothetical protein [Burkholderia pseudomallei]